MNSKDRKALYEHFRQSPLPEGFSGEEYDDFINFDAGSGCCRVLRVVGPRRHPVLFAYNRHPFKTTWGGRDYEMYFLDEQGELQKFNPKAVHRTYNEEYGHEVGWERAIGDYLTANGGKSFVGKGWLDNLAGEIRRLIRWWEKDFSGLGKEE